LRIKLLNALKLEEKTNASKLQRYSIVDAPRSPKLWDIQSFHNIDNPNPTLLYTD